MPDSISDDNWEVGKICDFYEGVFPLCLTIIAEGTHYVAFIAPVSVGKNLNYGGLRQTGMIFPKWILRLERVCGFQT